MKKNLGSFSVFLMKKAMALFLLPLWRYLTPQTDDHIKPITTLQLVDGLWPTQLVPA
jgi:hypothetical protein